MQQRHEEVKHLKCVEIYYKPLKQQALFNMLLKSLNSSSDKKIYEQTKHYFDAHILLAEDNIINQKVSRISLESLGCKVTVTNNGKECVDAFHKGDFDLVLMDWHMPELDGRDAAAMIRELEKDTQKYTPILAFTANAMSGDKEMCFNAGMNDYLSKPVVKRQLISMLHKWIPHKMVKKAVKPSCELLLSSGAVYLNQATLDTLTMTSKGFDDDFMQELILDYLEQSSQQMAALLQAIEDEDCETIFKQAHSLKSSSATLGAEELAILCQTIEHDGRAKHLDAIKAILATFKTTYEGTIAELRSLVQP